MKKYLIITAIILSCCCVSNTKSETANSMQAIGKTQFGVIYYMEHKGNGVYVYERNGSAGSISTISLYN